MQNGASPDLVRLFEATIRRSIYMIAWVDAKGSIAYLNDAALAAVGRTREDAIGRNLWDLYSGIPDARWPELWERVSTEGSITIPGNVLRGGTPTGSIVENTLFHLPLDGAEFIVSQAYDVTDRRRIEQQLLQSQKMDGIGRLAGGIAHDFNNLLTAIGGYAELARATLPPDDPARSHVEQIIAAGERATGLTRQLLAFARQQVIAPRLVDLNRLALDMDRLLRQVLGEDISLRTVLAQHLAAVEVDPGQFEQVLLNLAVNARDAMPRGGCLTIETANVEIGEEIRLRETGVGPGPYVRLAVSDTGEGMDPDVAARVFEPFFTTKDQGKGTGLGLATVHGVVKQSGGFVTVYSERGSGTCFRVYLPARSGTAATGGAGESAAVRGGTEHILLVEDDSLVRQLAASSLRDLGYSVATAESGTSAIGIAAERRTPLDLVVIDVVMPDLGGRELAEAVRHYHPAARTLFISGYTEEAVRHRGALEEHAEFLAKPFSPSSLGRKVREVLDKV